MGIKKGQMIELTVADIAFGGRGLARVDGMAVFVDGAVPSDVVRARVIKKKKKYAEARTVEILSPSPHRIAPPCPYAGYCGGCKWQFLGYDRQLLYKRRHVAEALEHIALIDGVAVEAVLPSDAVFGYRNKMEFSCADRRWLLPSELARGDIDQGFAIGLHVPGTFDKVLDIDACLLQPDLGNRILGVVRRYIRTSPQPVYGLRSHTGFWRFLTLRHSVANDCWMVNLVTASLDREAVQPLAEALRRRFPTVAAVVNNVTDRKSGVAVGDFEVPLAGADAIEDAVGPLRFKISANSFFQTNTRGAERLYETVRSYAALSGGERVLDLYCGTGTIGIFLSDAAAEVTGIELAASAVGDARANCRRNGIDNCRFIQADMREGLKQIDRPPDVMIIDPPRAGMHKDVVRQIIDMAPPVIVYVSCNPSTLARDLGLMKAYYHPAAVQPVDMFPHTFHIEAVARLERVDGEPWNIRGGR